MKRLEKKRIIKERPNKYVLKYGKSITEIAEIFGVSNSTVTEWDKDVEKSKWLKQRLEEITKIKGRW